MSEVMYPRLYASFGLDDRTEELIEVYKDAFAAPPWNERTRCAATNIEDQITQCPDGYSKLAVGEECSTCGNCTSIEAYPDDELRERFKKIENDYSASWYIEQTADRRVGLAVLSRTLTVERVAVEKYSTNNRMQDWLFEQYDEKTQSLVWLDEVFADTRVREKGNLINFGSMCAKLANGPQVNELAFRTVNPKLVRAAQRDLGSRCRVFDPVLNEVPDRRRYVRITLA